MTETSLNIGTYIDSINFEPFFVTYLSDAFYLRKSIFCLILYGVDCTKMFYLFVSVNVFLDLVHCSYLAEGGSPEYLRTASL